MPPTRRTVLLAGLAGLGVAAVGVGALGLRGTTLRPAPEGLLVFDAALYSIAADLADTLHPGSDVAPSGSQAGVPEGLDAIAASMHPADRDELLQALGLIENALVGALMDGRLATFTGSSPETRAETLRRWQTSSVQVRRQAFKAIKGLCAGIYWSNPAVFPLTGYRGAPDFGQAAASKPTTFPPLVADIPPDAP